ncbi:MAG: restriction endonuclease subunit S [Flavobacterium sp.]|nr:restriction endonuclease subunit S [Flavobacterium sp.]
MEKELPKNWVSDYLYNVLEPVKTGVKIYDGIKSYYSTGSIKDNGIFEEGIYDYYTKPSRANREVEIGDILQARMSYTDKALLVNESLKDSLFSTGFIQLRPFNKTINSKYVLYFLKSDFFHSQKDELASGTTQVAINDLNAKKIEFPLPPLAEQNRIVDKLDILFAQLETIKTSMAKVPLLLKDFRQQVLTQAVTGKLTEEWRKGKELEEWKEYTLESISTKITDGKHGDCKDEANSGYYFLSVKNMKNGSIDFSSARQINFFEFSEVHKRTNLSLNDLLISSTGATIGKTALVDKRIEFTKSTLQKSIAIVKPIEKIINPFFLKCFFDAKIDYIKEISTGTAQPNLLLSVLRKVIINLPSLKEQQEIVYRVESLFAKADAIEKQYETLKAKIDSLPQAILHKALKGELTEQLDSDGDAKELLQQIQSLRAEQSNLKKKGKKVKV